MNSRSWFQELVPFRRSSSSKRHRQRRNLLRTLRSECLESRTLMAADVYVVPATPDNSTDGYYVVTTNNSGGSGPDVNDIVTWYSFNGTGAQVVPDLTYGTTAFSFDSLSQAVALVDAAGGTLHVGAGMYAEPGPSSAYVPLTIDKPLTLLGPNAGLAGVGVRNPEAKLVPPTGLSANPQAEMPNGVKLISITAAEVTIDGMMIDGLGSGTTWTVDVGVYSTATETVVTNSVIRNIFQFGVSLAGTDGTAKWGEISNNKFDNIPYYSAAIAFNDYYAKIDNNSFTNVWVAIQTNNHHTATAANPQITNNTMLLTEIGNLGAVYGGPYTDVGGIFHNLQYANATPWVISGNTLTNSPVSAGSIGITIWSVSVPATFTGNSITGFAEGYDLWNSPGPITIKGTGGNDTIYFSEDSRQYTWTRTAGSNYTVTGPNGSVLYVENVNQLVFTDGPVLLIGGAVTGSALCTFDTNPSVPGDQFNLAFTPFNGAYRLTDTNPGQFYYNLVYSGTGGPNQKIDIDIPYAFMIKGKGPVVSVYNDVTSRTRQGEACFNRGQLTGSYKVGPGEDIGWQWQDANPLPSGQENYGDFYRLTIPQGLFSDLDGFIYITVRLDYSLEKKSGWLKSGSDATWPNGVIPSLPSILNNTAHNFSALVNGNTPITYSAATVYNDNKFKTMNGVAGLFQADQSSTLDTLEHDPVAGQHVYIYDTSKKTVAGDAYTDEDGWYFAKFTASGQTATLYTAIWDQDNDGNWAEDLARNDHIKSFYMGGTAPRFVYQDFNVRDPDVTVGNITSYQEMIATLPDDVAPFLTKSDPVDNSTLVDGWSNLALTFSEPVIAGVGYFDIYKDTSLTPVMSISVTDPSVSYVGSVVTINPSEDLLPGNYYLKTSLGAVKDAAGNVFAGLQDLQSLNFTVVNKKIKVQQVSSTTTSEGKNQITFQVSLTSAPKASVTVPLSSSNIAEGTVSPSSLTFTAANVSQLVTVTGVDDARDDGDIAYQLVIGTMTSTDSTFNGNPSDISLMNVDNDTAGIIVSATNGTTTESGGVFSFTVRLASQPLYDVTIPISSSMTTEGRVSTSLLTFTSANWNVLQTVTVTGVDDSVVDGNVPYQVVIGAANSIDDLYFGMDPADISMINNDNDVPAIVVSATSGTTTESGGVFSFTVRLQTQPTANVFIPISSSNTKEGIVSVASLTFTSANWNSPQAVTVTGQDDSPPVVANDNYLITFGAAISNDTRYSGLKPVDISMTNLDNDATKFYVVDDVASSVDRTYQYNTLGQSLPINATNTISNTLSRGIATTAAGDKLWVIDNNRIVYVYNNAGVLQGSWTAGTIPTNATVEGIATDGTNIWIIDSTSKRIYYYASAASRTTSAEVSATTSYLLPTANSNPRDLVFGRSGTAGVIWVVDDGATVDKVYRYSLGASNASISLVASWNLISNSSPTGITLDPGYTSTTGGDLWVLVNGATSKQVVRYNGARGVTKTSTTTPVTTTLAVTLTGLTNPQGIADPPPVAPVDRVFSDLGESVATASRNATAAPRSDAWSAAGALVGGNSQNGLAVDRRGSSLAGIPAAVDYRVASAVAKNSTAVRGAALVTDSTLPLNVKKTSQPQSLSAESVDRLFEEFPGTRKRS